MGVFFCWSWYQYQFWSRTYEQSNNWYLRSQFELHLFSNSTLPESLHLPLHLSQPKIVEANWSSSPANPAWLSPILCKLDLKPRREEHMKRELKGCCCPLNYFYIMCIMGKNSEGQSATEKEWTNYCIHLEVLDDRGRYKQSKITLALYNIEIQNVEALCELSNSDPSHLEQYQIWLQTSDIGQLAGSSWWGVLKRRAHPKRIDRLQHRSILFPF